MTLQPTIEEFTALQQALQASLSHREKLTSELRFVSTERDLLKERLDKILRKFFAAKSEARGTEQKDMFFNEAEALAAATQATPALEDSAAGEDGAVDVPAHKRLKRGRKPLDADLPRHVVRHELPESERVCPHDGSVLQEIGVEASEQLDIIPQQVRVIRHERVKYACPCCDGALRLASKPAQIIPKGLFSESALAWIATSKFDDGLPLYRQAALLARFAGGDFSKNTMAASMVRVGIGVQPIINLMRDHLLESPITFGDETTVQVLKEPGRAAQSKSYMWAQMTNASGSSGTGPPIRLFSYAPSRSGATAQTLYAGMSRGSALDERRLRGLRPGGAGTRPGAPGLLGALPQVLCGGAGLVAKECSHARQARIAVPGVDRAAVRGGVARARQQLERLRAPALSPAAQRGRAGPHPDTVAGAPSLRGAGQFSG